MKHLAISDTDYSVSTETYLFGHLLHIDVYRWSKSVSKRLKEDLQRLRQKSALPLYGFHSKIEHDDKHIKFIKSVGGYYHHRAKKADGEWVELYKLAPLRPV